MQLDLPLLQYQHLLQLKTEAGKRFIFDVIRRSWVVLQPEETVRQLILQYLLLDKQYNKNRIAVERGLEVNGLYKRCDVLVFDIHMQPFLLIECKAPHVPITQDTFRQIATYNLPLQVPYLAVTNGPVSFCCQMDYHKESFEFIDDIPGY
jgi:hypothetical protein